MAGGLGGSNFAEARAAAFSRLRKLLAGVVRLGAADDVPDEDADQERQAGREGDGGGAHERSLQRVAMARSAPK